MTDGVYMFEYGYRKQMWLVEGDRRKILKDLNKSSPITCSGPSMYFQPHSVFVRIDKKYYKYLRTLNEEEKLELL